MCIVGLERPEGRDSAVVSTIRAVILIGIRTTLVLFEDKTTG